MANALLTGISGLRGHQKMLEVVGNNLANMNTTAFKSSRVLFSDLLYETQRGASPSSPSGLLGSVNPIQVGTGSRVAQVDLNFQQGNLESTGNELDMAIDGGGFFVASTGEKTFYTRSGAFSIDESGYLTDTATGYLIQRSGSVGEVNGTLPAFQLPGDNRIALPRGVSIPGRASETIAMSGNLSSLATGPISQEFSTQAPLTSAGIPATAATLLNDLDDNTVDYVIGDQILILGTKPDGTAPSPAAFSVDATTTLGDLIAAMNVSFDSSAANGATVSLDSFGNILATDNTPGVSLLEISVADGPTNAGQTDFDATAMIESRPGKIADIVTKSVEVFDESGALHRIGLTFTKQSDDTWTLNASVTNPADVLLDGEVSGIRFLDTGEFFRAGAAGIGDANIQIQFNGQSSPQTLTLDFGTPGRFDGLTGTGGVSTALALADGYEPGTLTDFRVSTDGQIVGIAGNSQEIPIAQLAIASFRNVDGLMPVGNNYYEQSLGSGVPEIGAALSGGRGAVISQQLENSNVDLALEFTRLIIAQRGFSANARTITVTDQVLQELTSIIR